MKRLSMGLLVLAALAPGRAVLAQESIEESNKTVIRQKTVIDFQDVTIDGEIKKPEGSYKLGNRNARFSKLVKMRSDFMPELQKSADNL